MRIISGTFRGKQINAPSSLPVRPTTDFAKTALFNIIESRMDIHLLDVLDLFSGTGNIAFEFLSRGCRHVTCVDAHGPCVKFIGEQCVIMKFENSTVMKSDVLQFLEKTPLHFDFIFADPPYDLNCAEALAHTVQQRGLLRAGGMLAVEHAASHTYDTLPGFVERRKYGQSVFSFFSFDEKTGTDV